jgi:hypothetical protein
LQEEIIYKINKLAMTSKNAILINMHTSLYSLPQNETGDNTKYQDRWKSKEGILAKHHILKLLREGATEHFLQKDFIIEAFAGIVLIAIFITVLANLWFQEK